MNAAAYTAELERPIKTKGRIKIASPKPGPKDGLSAAITINDGYLKSLLLRSPAVVSIPSEPANHSVITSPVHIDEPTITANRPRAERARVYVRCRGCIDRRLKGDGCRVAQPSLRISPSRPVLGPRRMYKLWN